MTVLDWLLDSDPAIRWQVLQDLTDAPEDVVAAERARVATEGWGARLLELRDPDGQWAGGSFFPAGFQGSDDGQPWTATFFTLVMLRDLGLDPRSAEARETVALVRENSRWDHDGQRFFDGEVEPCINGRTVALGAYFGEDVEGIVDRLLGEQLDDGGWNCWAEDGSVRSSFDTTINVVEGLLAYEQAGGTREIAEARRRGEEYLLERSLFRRKSTGEVAVPGYLQFSFPPRWHYDVLRGLEYFRAAGSLAGQAGRRGDRAGAEQAAAGRHVVAGEHPPRRRPLPAGGRRRDAEPLEHAARPAGAALVRGVAAADLIRRARHSQRGRPGAS